MNTKKLLGKCAVGADIILPTLGSATVIGEPECGNVKVIVDGDRIGKEMHLRRGLMVIDTGSVSPNIRPQVKR